MTTIEKLARVLAESKLCAEMGERETVANHMWPELTEAVTAILQALREPGEAMKRAAFNVCEIRPGTSGFATGTDARNAVWKAMIDAILAGEGA